MTARERVLVAMAELGGDELEVLAEVAAGLQSMPRRARPAQERRSRDGRPEPAGGEKG